MGKIIDELEYLSKIIYILNETSRFSLTKNYIQHGNISVYQHCIYVSYISCKITNMFKIKVDKKSLIRGALLHDYFLYDWHEKDDSRPKFHGFNHPKIALKNADEDFILTEKEKDIILHHMFPLTLALPSSREAWIICLADKICATLETLRIASQQSISSKSWYLE